MVQGYYTLDEAARILGIATEELSHMAQRREVRAFADRGTWRFRTQDIEELARRRGQGSNPDLPLGEAPRPQPHDTPTARTSPEPRDEAVFPFGLGTDTEQVDLGQDPAAVRTGSGPQSPSKAGGKSSAKGGPKSPTSKPGSDSDVRLVPDGSNVAFAVSKDSDIKLVDDSATMSKSGKKPASGPKEDSGVKLVPLDAGPQSPVRLTPDDSAALGAPPSRSSSDSDVRLEAPSDRPGRKSGAGRAPEDSFLTEEIDLDAEMKKAAEASGPKKPQPRPASSPAFELSEAELDVPKGETPSGTGQTVDSSSDFDINLPGTDEMSAVEVDSKESQHHKDEEISLGDLPSSGVTGESGINLGRPTDSGISLEPEGASSDEIEHELRQRATAGPVTPPRPIEPTKEVADSSSDFELTLEDSGRLAPLEEERPAAAEKGETDIFETDFEVPALEDESGSQAMALDESDTDLESSDFDLALGEEDMAVEDESGSQVVALDDEEEADEGAATVARTGRRGGPALEEEETGEYAGEELEEEVAPSRRAAAVAAAPATWGAFTPIVLLFSFFVLFLVGLMSFELVRGMWGYHQSTRVASPVVRLVSGLFYDAKDLPND
jgi:hypothetical protein